MSPEGLTLIGALGLERINELGWAPDSVGGLTMGADPIAYAISYASAVAGAPVRAFAVRKEAKQHGTGRTIEGPFQQGDRVVVVEDVITTGGSFREAVEPIEAAGGVVLCCACIVDRSGGKAQVGWPLVALATVDVPSYAENEIPPELAALPAEEPGSKRLRA